MKTEYMLTEAQKAELSDIDRQIEMLYRRKADIYIRSNIRCVTETREEFEAALRLHSMIYDGSVIPKQGVVKMIFEDKE